jgi:hypothetical protein
VPLSGAIVELIDASDIVAVRGLTGAGGRFVLRAPPGPYRVSVGMLGYASTTTGPVELGAGAAVTLDVLVPLRPIRLAGIRASTERRCGRPRGSELVQVWDEARKVLAAVDIAGGNRTVRFQLAIHDRDLDPDHGRVLHEQTRVHRSWSSQSFESAPVDQLMTDGFIQSHADTATYFAPDAELLLSDAFLGRYCFTVVEGSADEIGLAFEPETSDRRRSQIEGVLWLDRAGTGLRRLEYDYLHAPVRGGDPGGEVHYRRLPNGAWIVSEWTIRMPRPAIVNGLLTSRLGGIHETRGEVVSVRGPGFTLTGRQEPAAADPPIAEQRRAALSSPTSDSDAQAGPPAQPGEEITTWVEDADRPVRQVLHLRNRSTATLHVTAITLVDCTNIREACGTHAVDILVPPGQSRALFEVHRQRPRDAVWFNWSYEAVRYDG